MTAPTATRTPQPAYAALRRHVLDVCRYDGDAKRCPTCRWLNADASAESYRREAPLGQEDTTP